MMVTKEMYETAFRYRKEKPWDKVGQSGFVFALELSNGELGYVLQSAKTEDENYVELYTGAEGTASICMAMSVVGSPWGDINDEEFAYRKSCIGCELVNKDELTDEEYVSVKKYMDENGLRAQGRHSYPKFTKHIPEYECTVPETEEECGLLCEAMRAVCAFVKMRDDDPRGISYPTNKKQVYRLTENNSAYELDSIMFPRCKPIEYPSPKLSEIEGIEDEDIKKLFSHKKKGRWTMTVSRGWEPVPVEGDALLKYPMFFNVSTNDKSVMFPAQVTTDYERDAETFVRILMRFCMDHKRCPDTITAMGDRTCALVRSFCAKLNIKLDGQSNIWELLDDPRIRYDTVYMDLEMASYYKERLEGLPPESEVMRSECMSMLRFKETPEYLKDKIREVYGCDKAENSEQDRRTYVIRVALDDNHYRDLSVPGECTMEELSEAILDSYGFDNDHAHAFFMNNKAWSRNDAYFAAGIDGERWTNEYIISDLELRPRKKFMYLFDFGDEWRFECQVLKIKKNGSDEIKTAGRKGIAPKQYYEF